MDTNYVYHLIGFSYDYIAAQVKYRQINDNRDIWSKAQLAREKIDYDTNHKSYLSYGMNRLGTFSSMEKVQEYIKLHPNIVSDHQYSTLLIEKHMLDVVDGGCFGDDDYETWYGIEEEWGDNGWIMGVRYHAIDRPDCFRQVAGFA